ncbi:hypothetical protein GW796_09800 [archaeon]|nr:hypothetical protein [archaeon]
MFANTIASSGISVQIIDCKYFEQASAIEMGGLSFAGIPIIYQIGGY